MALLLPHSVFFHIPKTGGSWVRAAVSAAGVATNEICPEINKISHSGEYLRHSIMHADPHSVRALGKFTFAFVRHPFTWYRSQWAFTKLRGIVLEGPLASAMDDDFSVFMGRMVERHPGFLSTIFSGYVGMDGHVVDMVGRQERLADDLVIALRRAGEDFDEALLRSTPPINEAAVSDEQKARCVCSPELRRKVCEAECWVMDTFGYREDGSFVA